MRYLPHTQEEIASMLEAVGLSSLDDLYPTVPEDCRRERDPDLPEPLTEWELTDLETSLSATVAVPPGTRVFLGAGSYEHYVPAVVPYLLSRSEFVTSYTPYQPEMSQGTLQAIYEYQTLVARLLGMEVANASLYDGASALAEALLMAVRIKKQNRIAISSVIHPLYRRVVQTYLSPPASNLSSFPTWRTEGPTFRCSMGSRTWRPWPCSRRISSDVSRTCRPSGRRHTRRRPSS